MPGSAGVRDLKRQREHECPTDEICFYKIQQMRLESQVDMDWDCKICPWLAVVLEAISATLDVCKRFGNLQESPASMRKCSRFAMD